MIRDFRMFGSPANQFTLRAWVFWVINCTNTFSSKGALFQILSPWNWFSLPTIKVDVSYNKHNFWQKKSEFSYLLTMFENIYFLLFFLAYSYTLSLPFPPLSLSFSFFIWPSGGVVYLNTHFYNAIEIFLALLPMSIFIFIWPYLSLSIFTLSTFVGTSWYTPPVWPHWAIYCPLVDFSKRLAKIILSKLPTFL